MSKENIDASALEAETPKNKINKNIKTAGVNYQDLEWLQNENAMDHLIENDLTVVSSKYDSKREPKVQEGLALLSELEIGGEKINPLVILLGKWWENKPVRKEIKTLIDKEAEEKGYEPSDYLQNVLGKQIDKFAEFQTAIDRIKYARTYFIPRGGIKTAIKMKQLRIDGDLYNVPIVQLNEIKEKYPNSSTDKKQATAMKKEVIAIAELVDTIEEL